MREEIKHAIDVVASHPKTAVVVAGAFNFNAWYGTYEPIAKFATSALGIILVCVLIVKHALDIKITLTSRNTDDKQ